MDTSSETYAEVYGSDPNEHRLDSLASYTLAPQNTQAESATGETAFSVFSATEEAIVLEWIAEGTDGALYAVPAEAGGWLRRREYTGPRDCLRPVSASKAATIVWYVYGDIGSISIVQR